MKRQIHRKTPNAVEFETRRRVSTGNLAPSYPTKDTPFRDPVIKHQSKGLDICLDCNTIIFGGDTLNSFSTEDANPGRLIK